MTCTVILVKSNGVLYQIIQYFLEIVSSVVGKTCLLNDVVRSRIQFGLLQGGNKGLHLSFVGNQLEFIVLYDKIQNLYISCATAEL